MTGARAGGEQFQPPIRIESRADLIHALTEASELEHGLLLQYLFAAFSMRRHAGVGLTLCQAEVVREWEAAILKVAQEEMAHLGTVSNLLTAIGGAPHFRRPNFPVPNRYFRMDDPDGEGPARFLEFALTPFSPETIARFVRFEAPIPSRDEITEAAEPHAWMLISERLAEEADALGALAGEAGAPPRLAFLHQNLRLLAANIRIWRRQGA
jgi:hypothetical protein